MFLFYFNFFQGEDRLREALDDEEGNVGVGRNSSLDTLLDVLGEAL